jgi:hypothetical protein
MQRAVPTERRGDVALLRRARETGERDAISRWDYARRTEVSEWLAVDEAQRSAAGCSGPCGTDWPAVALEWVPVPGSRIDEHRVMCVNCQLVTAQSLGVSLS